MCEVPQPTLQLTGLETPRLEIKSKLAPPPLIIIKSDSNPGLFTSEIYIKNLA